jgi:hypothetical protein
VRQDLVVDLREELELREDPSCVGLKLITRGGESHSNKDRKHFIMLYETKKRRRQGRGGQGQKRRSRASIVE